MRRAVAAIAAAVLLAGCTGDTSLDAADVAPSSPPPLDPDFDAGQAIAITDQGPRPQQLIAVVGRPITWTNASDQTVAIRSTSGEISAKAVAPGEQFRYTPTAAVSIVYETSAAPGVRGAIQVEPVEPAGDG